MLPEWLSAIAESGTLVVILASVLAALIQLRHIRAGNQLQALLSLEHDFRAPELQSALTYIQERLPQRLEDPVYRRELETIGFVDPSAHPEMIACNWLNEMGTLVKHGLVSEATFMDLFARLIVHCWRQVCAGSRDNAPQARRGAIPRFRVLGDARGGLAEAKSRGHVSAAVFP